MQRHFDFSYRSAIVQATLGIPLAINEDIPVGYIGGLRDLRESAIRFSALYVFFPKINPSENVFAFFSPFLLKGGVPLVFSEF